MSPRISESPFTWLSLTGISAPPRDPHNNNGEGEEDEDEDEEDDNREAAVIREPDEEQETSRFMEHHAFGRVGPGNFTPSLSQIRT
jgi:hypothetical protein